MSSLFTQISKLNQEAQQQRSSVAGGKANADIPSDSPAPSTSSSSNKPAIVTRDAGSQAPDSQEGKAPASGTVVPPSGTTTEKPRAASNSPRAARFSDGKDNLGKGSRLDLDKLKTVIEELSVVQANSNGLNVRMSEREHQDIEDFVLDTLRKHGLKGQQVSIAKLMRYAMRYMFRVHPQEFVTALRAALEVEETLSI